jgi:hypothetical protein
VVLRSSPLTTAAPHGSPLPLAGARPASPKPTSSSPYDPRNFLLSRNRGRAVDHDNEAKLERLNRGAISDLREANSALAQELLRLQQVRRGCREFGGARRPRHGDGAIQ